MTKHVFFGAIALLYLCRIGCADGWQPARNSMSDERWAPSSSLLADGKSALIAGGYSYTAGQCIASADIYDETTNRFKPCRGRMVTPRDFAPAIQVQGGDIVIFGGYNTLFGTLNTVEVFHPVTGTFRLLARRMHSPRELFTATLLNDGRVLITGGLNTHRHHTLASAELYDPKTDTFESTQSFMSADRFGQAAVRLLDGRVLIVGGKHWIVGHPDVPLASAEIFDPSSGKFHFTATPMKSPRDRPTATLLSDGRVLIAGGQNGSSAPMYAELFDPVTESFVECDASLAVGRMAHETVTLNDGRIMLAGGWSPALASTTASVEYYIPATGKFSVGTPMPSSVHDFALCPFPDGGILVAGGKEVNGKSVMTFKSGALYQSPDPQK